MINLYPQYLRAIREKICGVCEERTADGRCGLSLDSVCPIEMYLPKIVSVIHKVSSDDMADYVRALRRDVCADCPNSDQHGGNCPFRNQAKCVMDRYFALIVDAIDEVDENAAWPQCC